MPTRISPWRAALGGVGESLARSAQMFGQHLLSQQDAEAAQKNRMFDSLSQLMIQYPDRADDIATLAQQHWGIDLSPFKPTNNELLQPLLGKIESAPNELAIPSLDALKTRLQLLAEKRPELSLTAQAPGPAQMALREGPMQTPPGLASTPMHDTTAAAGTGVQGPTPDNGLPSAPISEAPNPWLQRLYDAAKQQEAKLSSQRTIDVAQKGAIAQAEGQGTAAGQIAAKLAKQPELAAFDIATSQASATGQARGQQDPTAAALERSNFAAKTPLEVQRKAGEAQAMEGAKEAVRAARVKRWEPVFKQDVHTTLTPDDKWIDVDKFRGDMRNAMIELAARDGVTILDKANAHALSTIDRGQQLVEQMYKQIAAKLPTDPAQRIAAFANVSIAQALQNDPTLAAFISWKGAAVPILRGLAGSEGLRINNQEIQLILQNDMIRPTDTLQTATRKLENLRLQFSIGRDLVFGRRYRDPSGQYVPKPNANVQNPGGITPDPTPGGVL
jgi:hypothetical protein